MTQEVCEDLLRLVRAGNHADRAAVALGIAPSTMRSHRARHRAFDVSIERAEAVSEASALLVIQRAASSGNYKAAEWILERRWPERWARPEIRAELAVVAMDTQAIVRGIHEHIVAAGLRHMPPPRPELRGAPLLELDSAGPGGIPLIPRACHPGERLDTEAGYVIDAKEWEDPHARDEARREAAELGYPLVVVNAPECAFVGGPPVPPGPPPSADPGTTITRS